MHTMLPFVKILQDLGVGVRIGTGVDACAEIGLRLVEVSSFGHFTLHLTSLLWCKPM